MAQNKVIDYFSIFLPSKLFYLLNGSSWVVRRSGLVFHTDVITVDNHMSSSKSNRLSHICCWVEIEGRWARCSTYSPPHRISLNKKVAEVGLTHEPRPYVRITWLSIVVVGNKLCSAPVCSEIYEWTPWTYSLCAAFLGTSDFQLAW
jgi:hypothetical protein